MPGLVNSQQFSSSTSVINGKLIRQGSHQQEETLAYPGDDPSQLKGNIQSQSLQLDRTGKKGENPFQAEYRTTRGYGAYPFQTVRSGEETEYVSQSDLDKKVKKMQQTVNRKLKPMPGQYTLASLLAEIKEKSSHKTEKKTKKSPGRSTLSRPGGKSRKSKPKRHRGRSKRKSGTKK